MFDCDVLVVGGGPVGEMLLALLGSRGVSAIGLEKETAIWPKPRAVHFDGETLRTFQSLGLGDQIAAQCFPMLNYRMENEADEVLFDIPTGALGSHGWHEDYMFHQPDVDAALRAHIEVLDSVELLTGLEVVEIAQDDDSVTVVTHGAGDDGRRFRARYLVGCDGSSSFVRRVMHAERESLGPNQPWLIVDGTTPRGAPIEGSMVFYGHHSRPRIWAAMPGGRARMEFKVLPGDDVDEITSPAAITRMSGGVLTPDNFVIERTAVYTFRSSLTSQWRDGRIFLAGDAAHLAPPLFGQGLCSGIRDVANLAWKLDFVMRGTPERILDSYESERAPHVRSWVDQATRMAVILQPTDVDAAAERDAFIRLHPEDGMPMVPTLGPGLHDAATDGAGGLLSMQPTIPGGQRFDDLMGGEFVLAVRSEMYRDVSADLQTALDESGLVHVVGDDHRGVDEMLASVDASAAVIRPDRYLLGAASDAVGLDALCRRLLGIVSVDRSRCRVPDRDGPTPGPVLPTAASSGRSPRPPRF